MIKLSNFLKQEIIADITSNSKASVLSEMVALIGKSGKISDIKEYENAINTRENILSTGIGLGVAVPHAKTNHVSDFAVALGRTQAGIDFDSIDDKPVHLIFMIAGPEEQQKVYLKILAKISLIARNEDIKKQIIEAQSIEEIYNILKVF